MDTAAALQTLLDREAIRECIFQYCRGIDRFDEAALRGAYWPDGTDCHGPYKGSASGFVDWALDKLKTSDRLIHNVGNVSIVLHGTQAAVETYFLAWQRDRRGDGTLHEVFIAGRYVDRFEKRGDAWRIADRTVVYDWMTPLGPAPAGTDAERFGPRLPAGMRKPDDAWYALLARLG